MSACLGDIVLTVDDVDTLATRTWLNDQVIAFQLERLHRAIGSPADLLILEPSLSFTASMVPDSASLGAMLSVPRHKGGSTLADELAAASLVLLPVNNNTDADVAGGGSHWSLLVYRRRRTGPDSSGPSRFEHYDSCGNANGAFAKDVALKLIPLLQPADRGLTLKLVSMTIPQQTNGFDCGVHALCIAEELVGLHASSGSSEAHSDAVKRVTPEWVKARRESLHKELSECVATGSECAKSVRT